MATISNRVGPGPLGAGKVCVERRTVCLPFIGHHPAKEFPLLARLLDIARRDHEQVVLDSFQSWCAVNPHVSSERHSEGPVELDAHHTTSGKTNTDEIVVHMRLK